MKRLLQFLICVPLAIILISLSVANRHSVTLSFDPFSATDPAISFSVPLFWLIFINLFIGLLLGGFVMWLKQGRFRKEVRDQRYEAAKARHEIKMAQEKTRGATSEDTAMALLPSQS